MGTPLPDKNIWGRGGSAPQYPYTTDQKNAGECCAASDLRHTAVGPSSFSTASGTFCNTPTNSASHARPMKTTLRRKSTATN
jgi:hypothetical protein